VRGDQLFSWHKENVTKSWAGYLSNTMSGVFPNQELEILQIFLPLLLFSVHQFGFAIQLPHSSDGFVTVFYMEIRGDQFMWHRHNVTKSWAGYLSNTMSGVFPNQELDILSSIVLLFFSVLFCCHSLPHSSLRFRQRGFHGD
jgi:hypothetical protein